MPVCMARKNEDLEPLPCDLDEIAFLDQACRGRCANEQPFLVGGRALGKRGRHAVQLQVILERVEIALAAPGVPGEHRVVGALDDLLGSRSARRATHSRRGGPDGSASGRSARREASRAR